MTDVTFWQKRRGNISSYQGGWRIGAGVANYGFSMMDDLVGQVSYMQVMMLNATGRLPDKSVADWVDAVHICLSWPDARIWCNQIGALAADMQLSAVAATSLGNLAADSRSYGIFPLIEGVDFIQSLQKDVDLGVSIEALVKQKCDENGGKPYLMGYARPIAKGDERIVAMERVTKQLGFAMGKHMQTAYQIADILQRDFDEGMNINGYMSAFMSDQGFSAQEVYRIYATLVQSGVTACYTERLLHHCPNSFLPLQCNDIAYQGKPIRAVPD